jgi:hypothetical protein
MAYRGRSALCNAVGSRSAYPSVGTAGNTGSVGVAAEDTHTAGMAEEDTRTVEAQDTPAEAGVETAP